MRGQQDTELVEAYECDRVDVGCVTSNNGPELLIRFHPIGAMKDIAFAIPPEDAEDVIRLIRANLKSIQGSTKLN
jgi:hypothetical protein